MSTSEHEPGCVLDPVHWLRHAVAAINLQLNDPTRPNPDRLAAASLLNALEHFAEQENWRTTNLLEVAQYASLMGETFASSCTCGRGNITALEM